MQSSEQISAVDAERIRRRYPRPLLPRPLLICLVALLVLAAGGWLVATVVVRSSSAVTGIISAYTVRSDTEIVATLSVNRADPSRAASCRVIAQATDFQPVAERLITVPASAANVVNLTLSMKTLRRATTAVVKECSLV